MVCRGRRCECNTQRYELVQDGYAVACTALLAHAHAPRRSYPKGSGAKRVECTDTAVLMTSISAAACRSYITHGEASLRPYRHPLFANVDASTRRCSR
jgi:hypothetical protein